MFHEKEDTMTKDKKNTKSILDRLTYAYIRKIKKWMFCPACKDGKMNINKNSTMWICEKCGYKLSVDEFEDNYVFWFCDECESYLNIQEGFDRKSKKHICKKCGYENDTSFSNIKGICSDCGKVISDPDATLCNDCKQVRKEKAKEWLKTAGKVVGVAAAVAGAIYLASQPSDEDESNSYPPLLGDDEGDSSMKCANCGNTNESTLWDEEDTIYCSVCHHRTNKENGEDDLVECPYCHRMRDRKAYYCRYCNDSTWEPSTPKEFKEIDTDLKEMGY